ncbi:MULTISPECIES: tRNA (adenosine(37)-N6)-threonylcarbamoyltransferase complex dimerization subunit type 1 TsaB [Lactobacillus]|uniref:tRNA (Adenosine(37)-N6)-threonylcarbamoyltransferase complex dimerization subunit type 1 TsaB n=1 Tax=Lactobacillus xujianguonis TaxID=2495899 RepID=A0A437SX05_9LACO|nr:MULTISPECIES: tRNA (adenosine(37)-N6)-threonylcarbamoyltransferase complex dimerization subunit type 1 TsaB [Lactobacillus]RVU71390.1 tRNA (adenosine(37)-N6)-threonylcarbamoyltransferase complex dimerization subunit type 1 TsaB [Lactobacillus xujianguonis]RVU76949.1 tRNA (adenosine(37)-N6)-threonylcarbamoyltransferase complex dimerization subunit type 1 TsaB [Lactobacillus xujianguonis]
MKILSVSTATNHLSVALNNYETIVEEKNEQDQRNHSEHLDPMIAAILKENNLQLKDLDRFAVAIGPGSYTGLRIGITTVKMFASILNKEVVGISTLQALAKSIDEQNTLIVTGLDARNDNYFAGAYVNNAEKMPEMVIPDGHYHIDVLLKAVSAYLAENDLTKVIFVGTGLAKQDEQIKAMGIDYTYATEEQNELHAGLIGQLAVTAQPVDPDQLLPRYLRRTQAEVDWHKKTGKPFGPDSDYVEEV